MYYKHTSRKLKNDADLEYSDNTRISGNYKFDDIGTALGYHFSFNPNNDKIGIDLKTGKIKFLKLDVEFSASSGLVQKYGLDAVAKAKKNSMGLWLIKELSEQIDANFEFTNENGTIFKLTF